ncbi:MAG: hypothetical protein AAGA96_05625 [Verrucomicrobiota bacterium]
MKSNALACLVAISGIVIPLISFSDEKAESKSQLPPDVVDYVTEMCNEFGDQVMPAVLLFDDDGDGKVKLREMAKTLMSRGFSKASPNVPEGLSEEERKAWHSKQERGVAMDAMILKGIKTDADGFIKEDGFATFLSESLLYRLGRLGPLDTNGDNQLSLSEYAIGVVVTQDQEKDEEGFTESQRKGFALQDLDGDGFIKGREYVGGFRHFIEHEIERFIVTLAVVKLDANEDETISREEMGDSFSNEETAPESVALSESIFWLRELEDDQITALLEKMEMDPSST